MNGERCEHIQTCCNNFGRIKDSKIMYRSNTIIVGRNQWRKMDLSKDGRTNKKGKIVSVLFVVYLYNAFA